MSNRSQFNRQCLRNEMPSPIRPSSDSGGLYYVKKVAP